ncbi:polysaccharide biosynthesis/export family protein [Cognatishimia sp. MH4019]|uniref:polysaccharide biosynthesis/export family protein n=1 Tax=Cognatishimia sp. MH4019 TaxID=2854030 RepID=UPI001CD1E93A|nr:polysaccharide biosynthesis/export family protein [Cognatishimia sp. MH4019]
MFRYFPSLLLLRLLLVAALGLLPGLAAAQSDYRVNADDVLKIRVGQWNVSTGTFDEWGGISGDYTVSADGAISFPISGAVRAEGLTTSEIAQELSLSLRAGIGLTETPAVAVEIAAFNPIIIAGDVYRPGQIEYRPGLTVQQAVALAGGYGTSSGARLSSEARLLEAFGQRRRLILNQRRLLLRISRIEASLSGEEEFDPPAELAALLGDTGLIRTETEIFEVERSAVGARVASVEDLIALLESVIAELENQMDLVAEELVRAEEQFANMQQLAERGLARANLENAAAAAVTQLRLREIDLTVEMLDARSSLNEARREVEEIYNSKRLELLDELRIARDRVADLGVAIDTSTDLYITAAGAAEVAGAADEQQPYLLRIVPKHTSANDPVAATEQTVLSPGDTLVVRAPVLSTGPILSE